LIRLSTDILDRANSGRINGDEVFETIIPLKEQIGSPSFNSLRSHLNRIASMGPRVALARGEASVRTALWEDSQRFEQAARSLLSSDRDLATPPESTSTTVFVIGGDVVSSKYDFRNSQVGAAGDNAQAREFTQLRGGERLDLELLAQQLTRVTSKLEEEAHLAEQTGDESGKYAAAIESLDAARTAAQQGNESAALKYLSATGNWVFDFASKVGASLVAELIKREI
jgi:hypothetical protein